MQEILAKQREFFKAGHTLDVEWRLKQLRLLKKAIKDYEDKLLEALQLDLGKCEFEAYTTELMTVYEEIHTAMRNVRKWSEIRAAETNLIQYPAKVYIYPEPLGLVLILAPWNYPVQLVFAPLVAAIAAGNCAAVKLSELAPHTEAVIKDLMEENFCHEYISVFTGGPEMGQALLEEDFDHIFFTGSPQVGKEVMRAAAEHLTSVTLELGGKSPCIVEDTADLAIAAQRIMWGKCLNSGQTCVAPDYVLVDRSRKTELMQHLIQAVKDMYPGDIFRNTEYGKIINEKHFQRLVGYLDQGTIVYGGQYDAERRKILPTILDNVDIDSPLMTEEIFGPLLPIISYDTLDAAIQFVHRRPKPLALYLFTRDPQVEQKVIHSLSFGGGCINDTILHMTGSGNPFGGVGQSGMGSYHGKAGFDELSHEKVILRQPNELTLPLRYAPYKKKLKFVKKFLRG